MPQTPCKSPLPYLSALLFSLPNTAIIWVVVFYPVWGLTGGSVHPGVHITTAGFIYLTLCGWALLGSEDSPEVIYRSCRFGSILALLLPVTTGVVSMLWTFGGIARPPGLLPANTALEIPVYAAGIALVLILLFLTGSYLAARHMEGIPF